MDHTITIVLANDAQRFRSYFAEIGDETVITRLLRMVKVDGQTLIVVSDHREKVCPEDCVTIVPTSGTGTLQEIWINVRDYEFKTCRVLSGDTVLSYRMAKSIRQDRRKVGLYGNAQEVFGMVLQNSTKTDFLRWSLREWRKSSNADLSNVIQFYSGKLLLSSDYSGQYKSEIEDEVVKDDRKNKYDVGRA